MNVTDGYQSKGEDMACACAHYVAEAAMREVRFLAWLEEVAPATMASWRDLYERELARKPMMVEQGAREEERCG